MKTFKQFLKRSGVIPVPIHFKHITFIGSGIIPAPIHFKHVPKPKKHLKEEEESPETANLPTLGSWTKQYDNTHLAQAPSDNAGWMEQGSQATLYHLDITKKLSEGHNLSGEHKQAIYRYTNPGSHPGNAWQTNYRLLNTNDVDATPVDISAHHLSHAIEKHKMAHELHVYSGVGFDPEEMKDETGHIYSPAFISATHNKTVAMNFAKYVDQTGKPMGKMHIIHIHLKPGDPALHVEKHTACSGEYETIIQKGTLFKHHGHEDFKSAANLGNIVRVHHVTVAREPNANV